MKLSPLFTLDRVLIAATVLLALLAVVSVWSILPAPAAPSTMDFPANLPAAASPIERANVAGNTARSSPPTAANESPRPPENPTAGAVWPAYPPTDFVAFTAENWPLGSATIAGRILDANDVPIAGARVAVQIAGADGRFAPLDDVSRVSCIAAVLSDSTGQFRLEGAPNRPCRLIAHAAFRVPVTLPLQSPADGLLFRMQAFGQIVGIVRGEKNAIASRFTVVILPEESAPAESVFASGESIFPPPVEPRPALFRHTFDAPEGKFAAHVGVGQFRVIVFAEGTNRAATQLFVPAGDVVATQFSLRPATAIVGIARDSAAGEPLANAAVTAFSADGAILARTRTDADGRYRLDVSPDHAQVRVRIEAAPGAAPGAVIEATVAVKPDATTELDTAQTGAILTGTITDAMGQPLGGMPLELARRHALTAPRHAISGRDGRFRIAGLVPGDFVLSVAAAHGFLAAKRAVHVNGETPADIAVALDAGAHCRIVLASDSGAFRVPNSLRVKLDRDRADPMPTGADPADPSLTWPLGDTAFVANVEAVGGGGAMAEFVGVVPGRYVLRIEHAAFASVMVPVDVRPDAAGVQEFPVVLRTGFLVAGIVRDRAGKPLAGVTVEFSPTDEARTSATVRRVLTAADGRYVIGDLQPRTYRVDVWRRDFRPHSDLLTPGGGATTADFTLDAGAVLRGKVTDAAGTPISQGTVTLAAPPRGPYELTPRTIIHNGRYRFGGLAPGTYRATVESAGFLSREITVDVAGDKVADVALDRGATAVISVRDGAGEFVTANLRLTLVATLAGEPLTPREMAAQVAMGDTRISGLVAGEYAIAIAATGFRPQTSRVVIDGETFLSFTLDRGAAIIGHVRTPDGLPATAIVALAGDDWRHGWHTLPAFPVPIPVDARTGEFRIDGVDVGRYRLLALDAVSRGALASQELIIDGTTTPAPIEFTVAPVPRHRLAGRIADASNAPQAGLMLALLAPENPFFRKFAATTPTGDFAFVGIPVGDYELIAQTAEGRAVLPAWPITVAGDATGMAFTVERATDGVRVLGVVRGGIADRLGLRRHDIIFAVNNQAIRTRDEFAHALAAATATNARLEIRYRRANSADLLLTTTPGDLGLIVGDGFAD